MAQPAVAVAAATANSRGEAFSWLCITPLVLVLVPFFLAPLLAVVAASLFQTDGFGGMSPALDFQNYWEILTSGLTFNLYWATLKFTFLTWLFSLADRLLRCLLPGLPRSQSAAGPRIVSPLHGAVLDVEHHPNDLLDPAPRQARTYQLDVSEAWAHPPAARISAVFELRGGRRLRAPTHDLHDRADLQFDGPHRQAAR